MKKVAQNTYWYEVYHSNDKVTMVEGHETASDYGRLSGKLGTQL